MSTPEPPPDDTAAVPTLVLSPPRGGPGMSFEATATDFGTCGEVSFQWAGEEPKNAAAVDGTASVDLVVPADAASGWHHVTASCEGAKASAAFDVWASLEPPLTLAPDQGGPGTEVTATFMFDMGFGNCLANWRTGWFRWDDQPLQPSSVDLNSLSVTFEVPADASTGPHTVTATCVDARAEAPFTVVATEPPTLTLSPEQGGPGTSFTASATGFESCHPMSFQWDDQPLQPSSAETDNLTFNFTVPAEASTDTHTVTASCGSTQAPAPFTVTATEKPTLTLDTGNGLRGSQLTASGTGFACGTDSVQLLWDGESPLREAPSDTFTVPLTVPSQTSIGDHTVVASCRNNPDITDRQPFTVTSEPTPVNGSAVLTLQPTRGRPGDQVRVTGDRFSCANQSRTAKLSWDDGTQLPGASLDPSGHFDTSVSVPANTDARRLTLRASCSDGSAVQAADFTVVLGPPPPPPPPTPPPPPSGIAGWLIALIVGSVLLVVAYILRRVLRPRPAPYAQAVLRPGGPPVVTVCETPARGEATHAIRLQAHSDPGIQTIREVDDDYSRPR